MAEHDPAQQQQQQQQQPPQREHRAIQDEAEWLRQYGLQGEPHYGAESYLNQTEATERVEAQRTFQADIHAKLFAQDQDTTKQEAQAKEREANIRAWDVERIMLQAADGSEIDERLGHLALHSDTVYTMALSRPHFETSEQASSVVTLSLTDYSHGAIKAFLQLLSSPKADLLPEPPLDEHLVDCCRLAHYLQCMSVLDNTILPWLLESIDAANCLSMYQLADELNLPRLVEASLNHLLGSLAQVEEHTVWDDVSPELQTRIHTMQQLLQSRGGANRKQLFFASLQEYLAVFAEEVDYYRERLDDAVHCQTLHPEDSPGWQYAQSKIAQQRHRVQTLKTIFQEQKKLFRPSSQPPEHPMRG